MTRYLGERTFGKALAAEHEGIQSLAKRPTPPALPATNNFPWIRRLKEASQTIVAGGNEYITFNVGVEGSTDYASYFSVQTYQVKILQSGIYMLSCQMHWDVTFTGNRALQLEDGYSWPTGFSFDDSTAFGVASQAFCFIHRYPANKYVHVEMGLAGATNRDIRMGYFEIMRIGSYTGPNPTSFVE